MNSTQNTFSYGTTAATMRSGNNNHNEVEVLNKTRMMCLEMVLRVLCLVLTLVAAILVGVDNQTKVVQVQLSPNLPSMSVSVHAKWHYLSAFVFLVATNLIACGYAAISLVLSLLNGKKGLALAIATLDLVIVALLFSGIGAAGAVGLLGYNGNSHVQWNEVCNTFNRFCTQLTVGLVFSGIGSIGFLLLVLISLFKFQKN